MKTFVEFQFGYCTLIWMFRSREANSKTNHLQERSLKVVYDDYITLMRVMMMMMMTMMMIMNCFCGMEERRKMF